MEKPETKDNWYIVADTSEELVHLREENLQLRARLQAADNHIVIVRIIIGAALIIVLITFRYLRLRDRRRREEQIHENERILSIAEDLQKRLSEAENNATESSMLEKMGLGVLERLCEQYYIYEGTENLQPKLLKEAKAVIDDLRQKPQQLEAALDAQKNSLITNFKTQFPRCKEDDIRLFCLLSAGFNSTTISTLMGRDKQYIYNRIWRLKTRITESSAPDKEIFLRQFSK
ncbi:MAG: hypothetical protein IJQ52_00615 [Bacteroidales bacterium]|nr:hypothetical protein [Bacteroidales bacterium]MBR0298567.1 hypothetical protein [Bacteroidales bacterium]